MPQDFAFTFNTWSQVAEREVKLRYRFARLWVTSEPYKTEKGEVRYADLVGDGGEDEADGGPPYHLRYFTKDTDPYKIPSMELEHFIFEYNSFQNYLTGALDESSFETK